MKDEDKRKRYDNGTLNDDFYYPEEDEEIRRFGHHAHSFHDFFGFLFARMFARHGRGAFMVDPDDDTYDSAEEDDLTDDDDEDDDDDDENDQYYDVDPAWRTSSSRGAPANHPSSHGHHHHHHHPHSSDPAFASRSPTAIPDPRELSPPDQLKRPKVTLQKADLIVTWGYNNGPRKPVDTFILEMKREGAATATDKPVLPSAWQVIYTGQKQSVKVSGLDAGCIYKFRVKAGNGSGESPPSAETSITTPKAGASLAPPAQNPTPQPAPSSAAPKQPNKPAAAPKSASATAPSSPLPSEPKVPSHQGSRSSPASRSAAAPEPSPAPPAQPKSQPAPKAAAPKKSAEQLAMEKKAADLQAKTTKLEAELESAVSKKSKSQIESIFSAAKKAGIRLSPAKVDAATFAIREVLAQQERDRALNTLRQRLQQATASKSLAEVQLALAEAEAFPGKGLQQQILEARQLLEELEKDADVQRRLDDAIRAKDPKMLEKVISEAKIAGIPIKEAKKVLRGLVKGREVQDQISKALVDNDLDSLVDVLMVHKDRPPRDQDAMQQMDSAILRVTQQLRLSLEASIKSKDFERARGNLQKAASLSIDLKSQLSNAWRQQLEALELDEIRNSLRAALKAPASDRANLLQAALDRAATSPHSAKLQSDIDSAIQELERLALEESVRFQLLEALGAGAKDKLFAALQIAATLPPPTLQKEIDQAKDELDRLLEAEERRRTGGAQPRPAKPPAKVLVPVAAAPTAVKVAQPKQDDTNKQKAKVPAPSPAQVSFPGYAKAAAVGTASAAKAPTQPVTILTNKDREEFPPLAPKAGPVAAEPKRAAISDAGTFQPKPIPSHVTDPSPAVRNPTNLLEQFTLLQGQRVSSGSAPVPALATTPASKLAQADPTVATLFQALLGGGASPDSMSDSRFLGSVLGSSPASAPWLSPSVEDALTDSLTGVEASYVPAGLQTGDWAYQPHPAESSARYPKEESSSYSVFGNPHPLQNLGGWSPLAPAQPQSSPSLSGDQGWSSVGLVPGFGGYPGWYGNAFGSNAPSALGGTPPTQDPFSRQ